MPRRRRIFTSNKPVEISMRVREGLPFIPTPTIELLLRSAMARANRDNKVEICHYLWHTNHAHILFVVKDANQAVKFYMELRRKVSEYIKRLAGRDFINLWESRPSIIQFETIHDVVERIAYIYSNPAKDDLVDSISGYPGYSSYNHFLTAFKKDLDYKVKESTPYVAYDSIEPVGELAPSSTLGQGLANQLKRKSNCRHHLIITPNSWIKCFREELDGLTPACINSRILDSLREREEEARRIRREEKRNPLGLKRLVNQPFLTPHTPKKKERRIFVICYDKEIRMSVIEKFKAVCARCRELYELACKGIHLEWPPGTFKPPIPPLANALAF